MIEGAQQNQVVETEVQMGHSEKKPETVVERVRAFEAKTAPATPPSAQAQAAQPTEPQAPKAPSPADDPDMASRFAMLAKKEKRLAEERASLQKEREESQRLLSLKGKAKDDPDAWLAEGGFTLEELMDRKLQGLTEEDTSVEAKVARLEKTLADKAAAEEKAKADSAAQAQQARIDEATQGFKGEIRDKVSTDPDSFGLIAGFERFDDVFETCKEYFEQTGEALDVSKACQLVEAEIESDIAKALEVPKVRKLLESKGLIPNEAKAPQAKETKPLTLSNRVVSPTAPEPPKERLSADESKRRAAQWLQAQLDQKKKAL